MSDRVDDVSHYCGRPGTTSLDGMPDTSALEIDELTVRYGDTLAVDHLSLTIPAGQTVALLGANGAGKSTILNAVLGLIATTSGSVRVLGRRPLQAVRAGGVGAMLQHGGLPSEARVGEVIDLVRRSYPTAWPLDDLVATAGIDGLLGRSVEALSGGQRQRVLLAVALAGEPPLLLLDEPTSAMDVEGRRAFWTTMRDLAGRGHTVVFATHHLAEADAVADRVVVVDGGRVVADGTTADIKRGASGRTISFTGALHPRYATVPGVTAVSVQGDSVVLTTTETEATLLGLLAGGRLLPDLEVRGASLEDAVLSLTDPPAAHVPAGTEPTGALR
jgi:ABC-2 type transport system ATP-binding protein